MRPSHPVPRATFLLLAMLFTLLGVLPVGCAETKIRTPDGFEYMGQKNVSIDSITVKKFYPDGKPMLEFEAHGVTSDPTAVNAGTVGVSNKALDKVPSAPLAPR